MSETAGPKPVQAHLICGGVFHDFDFARLELLKLLAEHDTIRTTVASDYRDIKALTAADLLITYTCSVVPADAEIEALQAFLARGGRWFALHATNSITQWISGPGEEPKVATPALPSGFLTMLGSQFKSHPPLGEVFKVCVSAGAEHHPLVAGIDPFDADDELYLSDELAGNEMLLETRWTGEPPYFVEKDWHEDKPRGVMYLRKVNQGEVLYLTLGHCRGHYDFRPVFAYYPKVERCSWTLDVFYELLRRGIGWGMRR
jgi:hypothetical protein